MESFKTEIIRNAYGTIVQKRKHFIVGIDATSGKDRVSVVDDRTGKVLKRYLKRPRV